MIQLLNRLPFRIILLSVLGVATLVTHAAPKFDFGISLIPESLSKNAHSVVRHSLCEYTYRNPESATARFSYAITIFSKEGIGESYFVEQGDKDTRLTKFKATVTDASGKAVKSYSKNEVSTTAVSSHLATDNFRYYLEFSEPLLPYTIHYEYEMEYTDGIVQFPVFLPVSSFNQSVQHAAYTLSAPASIAIHSKKLNFEGKYTEREEKGIITRTWSVDSLKAVEHERFAPEFREYMPLVITSPREFVYGKIRGDLTNAQTISAWLQELCQHRTELSQATKDQIVALTSGLTTQREKVEALYHHLGATTRYESIQLGVGGYQPIAADEVCRTGFGDCKGLSNYLKAMINHLGIEANLCVIRLDSKEKELPDDFTALLRSNHMIVQVPLPGDTLWLESTQTKVPFGYVHSDIAGHKAIVSYDSGGKMHQLPDYPDSLNRESYTMSIRLDEAGNANGTVNIRWEIKEYDRMMSILADKKQDQLDRLRKVIKLPGASLQSVRLTDNKSAFPSIECSYELSSNQFGSKTGNRLFVPVNVIRNTNAFFKKGERRQEIVIYQGWTDADEMKYIIPDGYTIENLPSNQQLTNDFGSFSSSIQVEGTTIIIRQKFYLKSGRWDKTAYPALRELYEKAASAYAGKIILRKS